MTTTEAGAMLGIDPNTVLTWIKRGRLASEQHGNRFYVRRRDVKRLVPS